VGSIAGVEEADTAATGVAAGLAWEDWELGLELGFAGGGLAVGVAELGSGDLAVGWAEVMVEVEDIVAAVAFVAVAREEAGIEGTAGGNFGQGKSKPCWLLWEPGAGCSYCKVAWNYDPM